MEAEKVRSWAEISLERLEENYRVLRELTPHGCRFMGMVKADAYGHGAVEVAKALESFGAEYLGVACVAEALKLRRAGIQLPILILGVTAPRDLEYVLEENLTQTVSDAVSAEALSRAAVQAECVAKIHIKVDTGMSRLGFSGFTAQEDILAACCLPGLLVEGIFTHFSQADSDEEATLSQFTCFLDLLNALEERGVTFPIRHCANSAATIRYPFSHLDMVRPGIALYGYYPEPETKELCHLLPVMELKSRVVSLRVLPKGTGVGYGSTWVAPRDSHIAVVAIGYGDGFSRGLSNAFSAELRGALAPIRGRVCMDLCMIDVTEIPDAALWDEVTLYSARPESGQTAQEVADKLGTIPYEVTCAVGARVPRVYIKS